jgi:uncharacterized protein (TIGR02217 family)
MDSSESPTHGEQEGSAWNGHFGVEVTADIEFDVPVRFDTDHMAVTIETYRLHTWQQIPIVELRT